MTAIVGDPELYPFKQPHASLAFKADVTMTTATGANPDGIVDEFSLLDPVIVPAYSATGLYLVTLKRRYKKVRASLIVKDVLLAGNVYGFVEGYAADNSVSFALHTKSTGAPVDSNNVDVVLMLELVP